MHRHVLGKSHRELRLGRVSDGSANAGTSPFVSVGVVLAKVNAFRVWKQESEESADEEIGPGDGELSSDDEEFNDVDMGLAKNMLESFKGQAGMAGPAGNLMRAMGVNMPRDEGDESD